MLTEMGKEGVMPTVDTFNTLMDACIRRVNPAAVPRLFHQMVQSGDAVTHSKIAFESLLSLVTVARRLIHFVGSETAAETLGEAVHVSLPGWTIHKFDLLDPHDLNTHLHDYTHMTNRKQAKNIAVHVLLMVICSC